MSVLAPTFWLAAFRGDERVPSAGGLTTCTSARLGRMKFVTWIAARWSSVRTTGRKLSGSDSRPTRRSRSLWSTITPNGACFTTWMEGAVLTKFLGTYSTLWRRHDCLPVQSRDRKVAPERTDGS